MEDRFAKAESLFHMALDLPPEEREAFLEDACGADADLRAEVMALLRAAGVAEHWIKESDGSALGGVTEAPGSFIGHYKLLEQIGEGGCGVVYMAEQREPIHRRVALKVIKLGMDTKQVVARFEAERQALALMDHPNIAKVLDAGATDTGRPYFVMELVHGIKVTGYCDQNNLSTAERLGLFIQICQAVQHAHQKGVIHRDLKPSNILVTLNDGIPVPKIIDFGIAKATGEQRLTDNTLFTAFEQFLGTPAYMSPEQAEMSGLGVDTRTDIYSLGVLLYELLTGKTPFDTHELMASGLDEVRRTIREKEPARPSTRLSTMLRGELDAAALHRGTEPPKLIQLVRGDLDWVVMKCLEKDRTRRYETASALALDIQRHLTHEAILARPPNKLYRFQKLARRNKLVFAAAGMVVSALALGFGVAIWFLVRERVAHDEARERRKEAESARLAEHRERLRAEAAVTHLEIERAEQLFAADNSSLALAYLARILRQQPTNRVVAERILSALSHRNFSLPRVTFPHRELVHAATFSPDGARVATASQDGTARVWDSSNGTPITGLLRHQGPVMAVRFSFDARRIVTGSQDNSARVWDAISGAAVTPPLRHSHGVIAVDFSPDGKLVATASEDMTARVWDAVTGEPVTAPLTHKDKLKSVCFSPDGHWLLTAAHNASHIWDSHTGQRHSSTDDHGNSVNLARFSPDGTKFFTASATGAAVVWEAPSGRYLRTFGGLLNVYCADFSPDGGRIAAGGAGAYARVWDLVSGIPITPPMQHAGHVVWVRFAPDGRHVLTGSDDNTVRIWDAQTGQPVAEPLYHEDSIRSAEVNPDGQRLLSVSGANHALIWELRLGQPLAMRLSHRYGVAFANFNPDGRSVVTISWDKIARIWGVPMGNFITNTTRHSPQYITSVAHTLDGERLVTASFTGLARVWDANTGEQLCPPLVHGPSQAHGIYSASFSPDGLRVITASRDHTARVWDARTGATLLTLQHPSKVRSARFSPDGQTVATACDDGKGRLWNAKDGQLLFELRHAATVKSAEFSRDGLTIVTASEDKTARRWDAKTGQPLGPPLRHKDEVASALFSPDGTQIVTRCTTAAYIWDARHEPDAPLALTHQTVVRSATFSPDSLRVLTASDDKTARIWDAATGHALSEPMQHPGTVNNARFSADGRWLITAPGSSDSGLHHALITEVPQAPLPIASWLADLAESLAGQRLGARDGSQAVAPESLLGIHDRLRRSSSDDHYTCWGKWFFADQLSRTISPSSPITTEEYIRRQIEEHTLPSLEKALLLAPTNPLAIGRFVRLRLKTDMTNEPWELALADWQTRMALRAAPGDPEVLAIRTRVCERMGASEQELLALHTRFAEASRSIDNSKAGSTILLRKRAKALQKLNRSDEAAEANLAALHLLARDPATPPTLIDLSYFYNFILYNTTPPLFQPRPQRLGDVEFDIRGSIRLACANPAFSSLSITSRLDGVTIGQTCHRLHFLHGVFAQEKEGVQVATYVIHCSDGQTAEIPIKYGEELRTIGFRDPKTELQNPKAAIVWRGTTSVDGDYRLFSLSWDNPRPDVQIETLDFISNMTDASPVLVAITVEP